MQKTELLTANYFFQKNSTMNKSKKQLFRIFIISFCVISLFSSCDRKRQYTREGNSSYNKKEFAKATEKYESAIANDSTFTPAIFNRGNSFYMSSDSNYKAAIESYEKYLSQPLGKTLQDSLNYANAFYNKGNSEFALSQQNPQDSLSGKYLQQAAMDYQQSLLLNPKDTNAKYNLALCLWLMKNDNQSQNQNQQQSQQMLEAMKINEKRTLERTKKVEAQTQNKRNEKDW